VAKSQQTLPIETLNRTRLAGTWSTDENRNAALFSKWGSLSSKKTKTFQQTPRWGAFRLIELFYHNSQQLLNLLASVCLKQALPYRNRLKSLNSSSNLGVSLRSCALFVPLISPTTLDCRYRIGLLFPRQLPTFQKLSCPFASDQFVLSCSIASRCGVGHSSYPTERIQTRSLWYW
jgi:hypothetical protein